MPTIYASRRLTITQTIPNSYQRVIGGGIEFHRVDNAFQVFGDVIQIEDGPLATLDDVVELPQGEVGELIVRGPVVTREYVTRVEANTQHKIRDGDGFWHRMGDVGYLDEKERVWFCGRKTTSILSQALTTEV